MLDRLARMRAHPAVRLLRTLPAWMSSMRRVGVSAFALALLGLLAVAAAASAAPAAPITIQLTQPDGSVFLAREYGDEDANGFETASGYTIVQDSHAVWRYAQLTATGSMTAGLARADAAPPPAVPMHLRSATRSTSSQLAARPATATTSTAATPVSVAENLGHQPELVLLVRFANQAPSSKSTAAVWHQKVFGSSHSVRNYYAANSYGTFSLDPARETFGKANDGVVGWLRLAMNHPNSKGNINAAADRTVFVRAIQAASRYVDFASYDTNGDGYIQASELHVSVIVAGYEASYSMTCGNSVWSHESSIGSISQSASTDGVVIGYAGAGGAYMESGEQHCTRVAGVRHSHLATIGLLAHEMGHDLGLPDLYDTDYSSYGIGVWSVMSLGAWNFVGNGPLGSSPAMLDPWSRSKEGWLTPFQGQGAVSLPAVETSPSVLQLLSNPSGVDWTRQAPGTGQYFLVENRQKVGYDAGLPGCGILIWHIDESMATNADDSERLVGLVQGDGRRDLDQRYGIAGNAGDAGDVFSGSGKARAFTNSTSPSSKLYGGANSGVSVKSIAAPCDATPATLTVTVPNVETVGTN